MTEIPLPGTFRPVTLDSGVRAAANRFGGKVALREGERSLDYRALVRRINRVGNAALNDLGLRPGDHAAILAPNCLEYIEVVCGLSGVGVPVAKPSPRLTPREFTYICDDSQARVLFVHPSLEEAAREADFESVERIIVFGEGYEEWLDAAQDKAPGVPVQEWEPFSIPYTSGTTGKPKGVLLSHRSRTLAFFCMAVEFGCYSPVDRALAIAPLCHGAGFAFAMAPVFFGGFCEVLPAFDPDLVLRKIEESSATNVFMVPAHFHAIFALGNDALHGHDTSSLRTIISNAAPLPQATKEKIVGRFGEGLLHETYGSTEGGFVSNLRPEDQLRKARCVGLPFPCTEIRLLGDDGEEVAQEEVGELFCRSPYLFSGYWQRPESSAEAVQDGWVTAGDMAVKDEEGYIYLVDRKKDMILSGGLNVYPREVEEILFEHPAVSEAAVIGIPDEYWGEVPKAFVVLRAGETVSEGVLLEHCRGSLAGYKTPKSAAFVDVLPRNAAGKVLKTELRAGVLRDDRES